MTQIWDTSDGQCNVIIEILGITSEAFMELNFIAAIMSAHNQSNLHLLANHGLELEGMLQEAGPFKDTVYSKKTL